MPIYEYKCERCGQQFELLQRFDDPPRVECSFCGGEAERIISLANFHLKGTGWYATDYKDKDRGPSKDKAEEGGRGEEKGED